MKKTVLWLFVVMVVSFTLAGITYKITGAASFVKPALINVNEERKLDLEGIHDILVKSVGYDIRIIPVDEASARVHFYGKLQSRRKHSPRLEVRKIGDLLEVKVMDHQGHSGIHINFDEWNMVREAALDLYLPKRYQGNLKTDTVSGSLQLRGISLTGLNCHSVSGDILLEKVQSEQTRIKTTSGEAVLRKCSGNLDLETVSGEITNEYFSGRMNLKTVSGDIDTTVAAEQYWVQMNTISGDVRIGLNKAAKFGLGFNTVSGECHSDFPIQLSEIGGNRRFEGSMGSSSDNRIEVHTVSGDLKITENK